jgi:hypothetical protein
LHLTVAVLGNDETVSCALAAPLSGSKITSSRAEHLTLPLPFEIMTHREWQKKAQQVYLKLETA